MSDPRLYGRRSGHRLRPGQQLLVDEALPRLRVTLPADGAVLDPRTLFTPPLDRLWIEVGFGSGEHLAAQAEARPHVGFIGCEPFLNGVARLLGYATERGLANVRVLDGDARLLLSALPEGAVGRLFVLFPDPWPKKRHNKRRFLGPDNLDLLARALADGAELRFASDHRGYVEWVREHLGRDDRFVVLSDQDARPADWPPTRYETKALARGETCAYLRYARAARGRD